MIVFCVAVLYLAGLAINIRWLMRLDLARMDFLDGILIGQAYYIIIPLGFFLIEGRTVMADVALIYQPYIDLNTTAVLILGMYLFPALRIFFPRVQKNRADTTDPRTAHALILLFVAASIVSFMISGLAQGGHWQENLDGAFNNPLFLPIKYAANVTRNAVFAVLLYCVTIERIAKSKALWIGLACAVFDLMTTFNRITAVYLLIMALLMLKHHPVRMVLAGTITLWGASALSAMWPAFRGLATAEGYTVQSFAKAWQTVRSAQEMTTGSLDSTLNGVFESSNIIVLNWIVQNYDGLEKPFIPFTMFARPVTLLLPGSVWPNRPKNFGLTLGDDIAQLPHLALNSTLYGESFANFGWFWPFGLSVFVLLWHGVYRLIAPNSRAVQAMGAFAAIAMWRFDASFVGCATLLTGALVFGLWLTRLGGFKIYGQFYSYSRRLAP